MKDVTKILTKSIEDILHYDTERSVEHIMKTVFETIFKLERSEFLNIENIDNNKGNGYYQRTLKAVNNYFKLKIPRDRLGLFKPAFLDILKQEEAKRYELAYKLYVKGLSTREIESIFKDVFNTKYSAATISNINSKFQEERDNWLQRPLEEEYFFIYIDAMYVPIRRDTVSKEAFYTVIGLKKDLTREVLGIYNIPTESSQGWKEVFKEMKSRGLKKVLMIVADGLTTLEKVVEEEFPGIKFQKCIVHKIRDILIKARSSDKSELSNDFKNVFKLELNDYKEKDGRKSLTTFINKWKRIYPWIVNKFKKEHLQYYFAYLHFPSSIHRMIYTTNWVERLHRSVRRSQKVRLSFPSPDSAINLICAILMDFESKVYKYPVTAFSCVREGLLEKLNEVS